MLDAHSVSPRAQESTQHIPALHAPLVHNVPHVPQSFGLLFVSTHWPLQHAGETPPQTVPHPPQLFGSLEVSVLHVPASPQDENGVAHVHAAAPVTAVQVSFVPQGAGAPKAQQPLAKVQVASWPSTQIV